MIQPQCTPAAGWDVIDPPIMHKSITAVASIRESVASIKRILRWIGGYAVVLGAYAWTMNAGNGERRCLGVRQMVRYSIRRIGRDRDPAVRPERRYC